jgi:hypothetical protein
MTCDEADEPGWACDRPYGDARAVLDWCLLAFWTGSLIGYGVAGI